MRRSSYDRGGSHDQCSQAFDAGAPARAEQAGKRDQPAPPETGREEQAQRHYAAHVAEGISQHARYALRIVLASGPDAGLRPVSGGEDAEDDEPWPKAAAHRRVIGFGAHERGEPGRNGELRKEHKTRMQPGTRFVGVRASRQRRMMPQRPEWGGGEAADSHPASSVAQARSCPSRRAAGSPPGCGARNSERDVVVDVAAQATGRS